MKFVFILALWFVRGTGLRYSRCRSMHEPKQVHLLGNLINARLTAAANLTDDLVLRLAEVLAFSKGQEKVSEFINVLEASELRDFQSSFIDDMSCSMLASAVSSLAIFFFISSISCLKVEMSPST